MDRRDDDPHDAALSALVHPEAWPVPRPADRYDLVVLGGGTAGLVSALGAAGLGARVALVERDRLGGDCLVTGCVPSKALLAAAHAAHAARTADALGVRVGSVEVDFGAVMERMRRLRAAIAHHDSAERLRRAGVDVFFGEARFADEQAVAVGGLTLRFVRAIVATGARPARPPIPGLEAVDALDSHTLFDLRARPDRLLVVGAGPVGCEMGQAFQRLGAHVTLLDREPRILPADDADAAALLARRLEEDGLQLRLATRLLRFASEGGRAVAVVDRGEGEERLAADAVLLAVGRVPNVDTLALDAAGVAADDRGVLVDDHLATSNPRVYAAGDVARGQLQFTHAADAMARVALRNALFPGSERVSALVVPWATFTDPEVAHVGLGQAEAARRADVVVHERALADDDRSVLEDETTGFARVYADRRGRILGATLVGRHAGEHIGAVALAMQHGLGLSALGRAIQPYPTRADVLRRLGGAHDRTRLTPALAGLARLWLGWRRRP